MTPTTLRLAVAALGLLPVIASADWIDVGVTAEKETVLMDSARYQRQGEAVTAAFQVKFPSPQMIPFSDKSYVTAERVYHFQCADKKFITATGKMLDKDGKVVYEFDASKNPFGVPKGQPVPPAGTEALAFGAACNAKK